MARGAAAKLNTIRFRVSGEEFDSMHEKKTRNLVGGRVENHSHPITETAKGHDGGAPIIGGNLEPKVRECRVLKGGTWNSGGRKVTKEKVTFDSIR